MFCNYLTLQWTVHFGSRESFPDILSLPFYVGNPRKVWLEAGDTFVRKVHAWSDVTPPIIKLSDMIERVGSTALTVWYITTLVIWTVKVLKSDTSMFCWGQKVCIFGETRHCMSILTEHKGQCFEQLDDRKLLSFLLVCIWPKRRLIIVSKGYSFRITVFTLEGGMYRDIFELFDLKCFSLHCLACLESPSVLAAECTCVGAWEQKEILAYSGLHFGLNERRKQCFHFQRDFSRPIEPTFSMAVHTQHLSDVT